MIDWIRGGPSNGPPLIEKVHELMDDDMRLVMTSVFLFCFLSYRYGYAIILLILSVNIVISTPCVFSPTNFTGVPELL